MSSKQAQALHDAAVLPTVQELWSAGWSLRRIAEHLQTEGVPAPRRGSRWSHKAVKRILDRAGPSTEAAATAPRSGPESPATPAGVLGPVSVTTSGAVMITATGPVSTSGPVTVTTGTSQAAETTEPAPVIERLRSATPLALSLWPYPYQFRPAQFAQEIVNEIGPPPGGARDILDPLFLRRRG